VNVGPASLKTGEPPSLAIGEFVLRPLTPADSVAWYASLSDPRVTEHTSWPDITPRLIAELVNRLVREYSTRASLRWGLARAIDDQLVGTCGYTTWSDKDGVAELAYDLAPPYWGRGVMRAAVEAAVQWALGAGGLLRVEALVMDTNIRSIVLLERCGFEREQLLRGHRLARGVPRDFWLFANGRGRPGERRAG
jgi:ribosomal-protein-alanine N-acetyltransferase